MQVALRPEDYARSPENLVVGLARRGDRDAFEELVRRRQTSILNLMRRCSGDATLANDLAQQVFLQAWRFLPQLRLAGGFGAWLKRIAISTWLQHLRNNDPAADAGELPDIKAADTDTGIALDLDRALATLRPEVRLCIVLSYNEGMTHDEIAAHVGLPQGTVKSHIRRGSKQLRERLAAYGDTAPAERTDDD